MPLFSSRPGSLFSPRRQQELVGQEEVGRGIMGGDEPDEEDILLGERARLSEQIKAVKNQFTGFGRKSRFPGDVVLQTGETLGRAVEDIPGQIARGGAAIFRGITGQPQGPVTESYTEEGDRRRGEFLAGADTRMAAINKRLNEIGLEKEKQRKANEPIVVTEEAAPEDFGPQPPAKPAGLVAELGGQELAHALNLPRDIADALTPTPETAPVIPAAAPAPQDAAVRAVTLRGSSKDWTHPAFLDSLDEIARQSGIPRELISQRIFTEAQKLMPELAKKYPDGIPFAQVSKAYREMEEPRVAAMWDEFVAKRKLEKAEAEAPGPLNLAHLLTFATFALTGRPEQGIQAIMAMRKMGQEPVEKAEERVKEAQRTSRAVSLEAVKSARAEALEKSKFDAQMEILRTKQDFDAKMRGYAQQINILRERHRPIQDAIRMGDTLIAETRKLVESPFIDKDEKKAASVHLRELTSKLSPLFINLPKMMKELEDAQSRLTELIGRE